MKKLNYENYKLVKEMLDDIEDNMLLGVIRMDKMGVIFGQVINKYEHDGEAYIMLDVAGDCIRLCVNDEYYVCNLITKSGKDLVNPEADEIKDTYCSDTMEDNKDWFMEALTYWNCYAEKDKLDISYALSQKIKPEEIYEILEDLSDKHRAVATLLGYGECEYYDDEEPEDDEFMIGDEA